MAQVLKDDVQEAITDAALQVFARDGYVGATMALIATAACVSTGNVYRYFESKEHLFNAVIDAAFVARFLSLLRHQVESARGYTDLFVSPHAVSHRVASEDFLRFSISHRLRVVVLLGRAAGSSYEGFDADVVHELVKRAVAHFRAVRPGLYLTTPARLAVEQAYRSLVATMVLVLATYSDEPRIRAAVDAYSRFHLAGLKALFEGAGVRSDARRRRRA